MARGNGRRRDLLSPVEITEFSDNALCACTGGNSSENVETTTSLHLRRRTPYRPVSWAGRSVDQEELVGREVVGAHWVRLRPARDAPAAPAGQVRFQARIKGRTFMFDFKAVVGGVRTRHQVRACIGHGIHRASACEPAHRTYWIGT